MPANTGTQESRDRQIQHNHSDAIAIINMCQCCLAIYADVVEYDAEKLFKDMDCYNAILF